MSAIDFIFILVFFSLVYADTRQIDTKIDHLSDAVARCSPPDNSR